MRDAFGSSLENAAICPSKQERKTKRNENCNVSFLPDPNAGTWVIPRDERILNTVLQSDHVDFFLEGIVHAIKSPTILLPRVTITKTIENGVENLNIATDSDWFQKAVRSVKTAGVGILSYHYYKQRHRMIYLIKNTENAQRWYIVDPEGIQNQELAELFTEALAFLLQDDTLSLDVMDINNVNFLPKQETIDFLKNEFDLKVAKKQPQCRHIVLIYVLEILCTGEPVDADHLTSFLFGALLRRSQIPLTVKGTYTEPPRPPEAAPTLSIYEEAELMLYARALTYGIYKHVKSALGKAASDHDAFKTNLNGDEIIVVTREKDNPVRRVSTAE